MLGDITGFGIIFILLLWVGIPAAVIVTIIYFLRGGFGTCPKCKSGTKKGAQVCPKCGVNLL